MNGRRARRRRQTTVSSSAPQGENELRLIGQGSGRSLIRAFYQTWNGNAPATPMAAAANYGSGQSVCVGDHAALPADGVCRYCGAAK
jgi:hypothetical protein